LSSRLKDSTDEAVLMLTGNVFHAEGPATVKERSPNLDRVHGMSSNLAIVAFFRNHTKK